MGETGVSVSGKQRSQNIVLKPEIQILPPVTGKNSKQEAIVSMYQGLFSRASWILDEPIAAKNLITQVFARETADLGQRVMIRAGEKFQKGDRLTVHRPREILRHPQDQRILGRISETLGIIEIVEFHGEELTAVVVKTYKEIVAGDLVDAFLNEKISIQFKEDPSFSLSAPVVYIENGLITAGLGQVVVVGLGMQDRVYPGLILPVYRTAPPLALHESKGSPRLDSLPVGEVALFRIADKASLALVTQSQDFLELGDRVGVAVSSPKSHENP
ncbi:MAG TPA: hypothetical protein HPQ00_03025 [Magnetococcales bacterium]|nr:hypothetical protein [Magnetococcales bacterium]